MTLDSFVYGSRGPGYSPRYLRLVGPFAYPEWVDSPYQATALTKARASAWANGLHAPPGTIGHGANVGVVEIARVASDLVRKEQEPAPDTRREARAPESGDPGIIPFGGILGFGG